ncbi:MAG TPA: hypothetical protein VFT16_00420 [Candidatus Saccharimonadales bacterium]|nr:hypothetical protein [Candidatus Saccharimonadales bacterium]
MSMLMQICVAVFGLTTVGLHLAKKNGNEVILYALQSLAVVTMLGVSLWDSRSAALLLVAAVMLIVKVVLAPAFFLRLVRKHQLKFSASTYANAPETFLGIALILLLVSSGVFAPLTNIVPENHTYLFVSLSALFVSLLLMINRRGALSQAVGILSMENSIVAFTIFAELEGSAMFEFGIVFDVFVWIIIAVVFVSMLFKHFGSLDLAVMKHLKG